MSLHFCFKWLSIKTMGSKKYDNDGNGSFQMIILGILALNTDEQCWITVKDDYKDGYHHHYHWNFWKLFVVKMGSTHGEASFFEDYENYFWSMNEINSLRWDCQSMGGFYPLGSLLLLIHHFLPDHNRNHHHGHHHGHHAAHTCRLACVPKPHISTHCCYLMHGQGRDIRSQSLLSSLSISQQCETITPYHRIIIFHTTFITNSLMLTVWSSQ